MSSRKPRSNHQTLNRFCSRASLTGGQPTNLIESAMIQKNNLPAEARHFITSSHVDLGEITEYNQKQRRGRRQRPQTGKASNQTSNSINPGAFKVFGQLHQQFQSSHSRRLTSAKGDSRFRTQQTAPAESYLSNTRDVIQSFGHLTTMAGSNYDQTTHLQRHGSPKVAAAALAPQQPIVRQHFMPNPAHKRLQSAKQAQIKGAAPTLVVKNVPSATISRGSSLRPKSGVITTRSGQPVSHRRQQSGKNASIGASRGQFGPDPLIQSNQMTIQNNEVIFDVSGEQIVQHLDPNQIALAAFGMQVNKPQTGRNQATQSTRSGGGAGQSHRRTRGTSSGRKGHGQTIYRLPSLSQCIENKILPRSSEYMRRLYSIALRNHETQVPVIAQRNVQKRQETPPLERERTYIIQKEALSTEYHDRAALDSTAPLVINPDAASTEGIVSAAAMQNTNSRIVPPSQKYQIQKNGRSQSTAQLKVQTLQFPFDSRAHGGYNLEKQRELQLNHRQAFNTSAPNLTPSADRKRPQTAGRLGLSSNIDLFNNKLISQMAGNQFSSPALVKNQLTSSATGPYKLDDGGDTIQPMSHQSGIDPNSHQIFHIQSPVSQGFVGANQQNLLEQIQSGKAQIVMCVKPQQFATGSPDPNDRAFLVSDQNEYLSMIDPSARHAANLATEVNNQERPETDLKLDSGRPNRRVESDQQRSLTPASRRSASPSNKTGAMSNLYRKTEGGVASQSTREFQPMHYQDKSGTQLVVQMSGQGITTRRLTSARPSQGQTGAPGTTTNDSKSQGSMGSKNNTSQRQRQHPMKPKLSSTHSLQINLAQKSVQKTSQGSLNGTNRLDDSQVYIDDAGSKELQKAVENDSQKGGRRHRSNSRSSFMSNQDLKQALGIDRAMPKRKAFPLNPNTQKSSVPFEESQQISLQSHSQNLLDTQMRLKTVYADENGVPQRQQVHRIPLPTGSAASHQPSQPSAREDSQRHQQVLMMPSDSQHIAVNTLANKSMILSKDQSMSTLSNPLNHIQMSVDRMKPIKIKSVVFDNQGGHLIREVERGYSIIEQQTVASDYANSPFGSRSRGASHSPARFHQQSHLYQQYQSSARRSNEERAQSRGGGLPEVADLEAEHHRHKSFRVTMNVKKVASTSRDDLVSRRRSAPAKPDPKKSQQATLKGRKMRLQSADMRHSRPMNARQARRMRQEFEQVQKDLNINLLHNQPRQLNESPASPDRLAENSRATVLNHQVPPLALPMSETGTEFLQVSHLPSSNRQQHLGQILPLSSSSQGYTTKAQHHKLINSQFQHQPQYRIDESERILNSFNANNVRSNLKGAKAQRIIQGIDLSEMSNGSKTFQVPKRGTAVSGGQMTPVSLSPQRRANPKGSIASQWQSNILFTHAESRKSLERLMVGQQTLLQGGLDEPQTNIAGEVISNRDFQATLLKEKSLGSKSDSEEKVGIAQTQTFMGPRLSEGRPGVSEGKNRTSPSPSPLIAAENTAPPDEEVIHEIEEGSSNQSRSKISVSVQSLRKVQAQSNMQVDNSRDMIDPGEIPIRTSQPTTEKGIKSSKNLISRNLLSHVVSSAHSQPKTIKSVYEVEAQALKNGLIKAYSGKGESSIAAQRRRDAHAQKTNQDLEHFLGRQTPKEDGSVKITCVTSSIRKQESFRMSYERGTRKSKESKQQPRNQPQANNRGSDQALESTIVASQSMERDLKQTLSQVSLCQQSSIGYNITQIAQKKQIHLERPPRAPTPIELQKAHTLESHQRKAHETMEAAKKLMDEAKRMKLDSEVVNKQLLALFSDKQETKHLDEMMLRATQELGTQTGLTGKSNRRGLEIPFQISGPRLDQGVARPDTVMASILTKKLSSASLGQQPASGKHIPAASFGPGSPTSNLSTVRYANEKGANKTGFNFAINSVGGSTTRFSKQELPFFGGVASSRIRGSNEVTESKGTARNVKRLENSDQSLETDANGVIHITTQQNHSRRGQQAGIIDYSLNFMTCQKTKGGESSIRKGSMDLTVTQDAQGILKPSSRRQAKPGQGSHRSGGRKKPNVVRYGTTPAQKQSDKQSSTRIRKHSQWQSKWLSQNAELLRSGDIGSNFDQQIDILKHGQVRLNGGGQQRQGVQGKNEDPDQPAWALRNNMKSKFNMPTHEDQMRQVQQFFIVDPARGAKCSPTERVMTQHLNTLTQVSQTRDRSHTGTAVSNLTTSPLMMRMGNDSQTHKINDIIKVEGDPQTQFAAAAQVQEPEPIESPSMASPNSLRDTNRSYQQPVVPNQATNSVLRSSRKTVPLSARSARDEDTHSSAAGSDSRESEADEDFDRSLSGGSRIVRVRRSHIEETVGDAAHEYLKNQSLQCTIQDHGDKPVDLNVDTSQILQRNFKRIKSGEQVLAELTQSSRERLAFNQSSSKSLANSRKVIQKMSNQGYVGRSRAGNQHFTVSQNLINSTQSLRKSM